MRKKLCIPSFKNLRFGPQFAPWGPNQLTPMAKKGVRWILRPVEKKSSRFDPLEYFKEGEISEKKVRGLL